MVYSITPSTSIITYFTVILLRYSYDICSVQLSRSCCSKRARVSYYVTYYLSVCSSFYISIKPSTFLFFLFGWKGLNQTSISGYFELRWNIIRDPNWAIYVSLTMNHYIQISNSLCFIFSTNIVSGHFDKRLRFWDERQDTSSHEMLLEGRITSVDLSFCGKYLACSCKVRSLNRVKMVIDW